MHEAHGLNDTLANDPEYMEKHRILYEKHMEQEQRKKEQIDEVHKQIEFEEEFRRINRRNAQNFHKKMRNFWGKR